MAWRVPTGGAQTPKLLPWGPQLLPFQFPPPRRLPWGYIRPSLLARPRPGLSRPVHEHDAECSSCRPGVWMHHLQGRTPGAAGLVLWDLRTGSSLTCREHPHREISQQLCIPPPGLGNAHCSCSLQPRGAFSALLQPWLLGFVTKSSDTGTSGESTPKHPHKDVPTNTESSPRHPSPAGNPAHTVGC